MILITLFEVRREIILVCDYIKTYCIHHIIHLYAKSKKCVKPERMPLMHKWNENFSAAGGLYPSLYMYRMYTYLYMGSESVWKFGVRFPHLKRSQHPHAPRILRNHGWHFGWKEILYNLFFCTLQDIRFTDTVLLLGNVALTTYYIFLDILRHTLNDLWLQVNWLSAHENLSLPSQLTQILTDI